jgi:hypothetical protein
MEKQVLVDKLQNKLEQYQNDFDEIYNNKQFREIAFGSAGNLSKASKNRLNSYRTQIGDACSKINIIKYALKIVNGETFTRYDLLDFHKDFILERNPEYEEYFYTDCFPIRIVKEMVDLIFDLYNAPYRKSVLSYPLIFQSGSGSKCQIPLQ